MASQRCLPHLSLTSPPPLPYLGSIGLRPFLQPRRPSRALQEPLTPSSSNPMPFYIDLDTLKRIPEPQKPMNYIEKQNFLKKSRFQLESPLGLDFGPSWPPFGEMLPPCWSRFLVEAPSPRALDTRPSARRNARERLNNDLMI